MKNGIKGILLLLCVLSSMSSLASVQASSKAWTRAPYSVPEPMTRIDSPTLSTSRGVFVEVNGDGYPDYVYAYSGYSGDSANEVWLNTGKGFVRASYRLPREIFRVDSPQLESKRGVFADINGDGLDDFIYSYAGYSGDSVNEIWMNTGNGWNKTNYGVPEPMLRIDSPHLTSERGIFVDINADGVNDLVYSYAGYSGDSANEVWINEGNGWKREYAYNTPEPMLRIDSSTLTTMRGAFADVNGDGKQDYAYSYSGYSGDSANEVWLNDLNGWSKANFTLPRFMARTDSQYLSTDRGVFVDVNGDTRADFIYSYAGYSGDSANEVWLNTGSGWTRASYNVPRPRLYVDSAHMSSTRGIFIDLNGDHRPEYVYSYAGYSGDSINEVWENTGSGWTLTNYGVPEPMLRIDSAKLTSLRGAFVDLDGDDLPDYVYSYSGYSGDSAEEVWISPYKE